MSKLRRIVLLRHGETVGQSSLRFHGSNDVELSDEGRHHVREAARLLRTEVFDLAVTSPLRRAWEAAHIVTGGAALRIEADFREIDFGRWEGLTMEEIEATDPALHREWMERLESFEFPAGESRSGFDERVQSGLERLRGSGASSALVVSHKGPICSIAKHLLGHPLEEHEPPLAGIVSLYRGNDGSWLQGRRGSDPVGLTASSFLSGLTAR